MQKAEKEKEKTKIINKRKRKEYVKTIKTKK